MRSKEATPEAIVKDNPRNCLTILDDEPLLHSMVWVESGKTLAVLLVSMPAETIRDKMEKRRIGIWSLRTVKRPLARLKDEWRTARMRCCAAKQRGLRRAAALVQMGDSLDVRPMNFDMAIIFTMSPREGGSLGAAFPFTTA